MIDVGNNREIADVIHKPVKKTKKMLRRNARETAQERGAHDAPFQSTRRKRKTRPVRRAHVEPVSIQGKLPLRIAAEKLRPQAGVHQ
jgi:hypothetical protein